MRTTTLRITAALGFAISTTAAQTLPPATETAALTAFLAEIPKGGDLHHHYSGAVYAETYLEWAGRKNMRIDPQSLLVNSGSYGITIDSLLNNSTLYRKTLQAWSDLDYGNHFEMEPAPDQKFFGTFNFFGAISGEFIPDGLRELKVRAIGENVQYIETMLKSVGYSKSDLALDATLDSIRRSRDTTRLRKLLDAFHERIVSDPGMAAKVDSFSRLVDSVHRGIDDSLFTMRFQTYVTRNAPPTKVFSGLIASFNACMKNALVVGTNIVGPENDVVAMRDEWLHARMFQYLRDKYPLVHVAMHAGELRLGMVKPEDLDHHINDAVRIAQTERVGHGVDLPFERDASALLAEMKRRGICVEINLTSNEFILGIKDKEHPFDLYRKAGVRTVLSTDDPGVSRNSLTSEFVLLASRYDLSYAQLKEMILNSIHCSFMDAPTKQRVLDATTRRFKEFESNHKARPKPRT